MTSRPFFAVLITLALFVSLPVAPSSGAPLDESLEYFLPSGTEYDPEIPLPSSVLGFEVGEWHVRHDLLVAYMQALASRSDRIELQTIGRTYEGRYLLQLLISSPENLGRIEEITREHARLSDADPERPELSSMPLVVNLGYSVHGNEPSGSNASLVVAYHLAAAQGPEIEALLANTVIVLDPSLNPDGLSRFAHWANTHRGQVLVADSQHREHREEWPSGRTNHYWFDLNRDWLLAQHPESRARLASFHRLRPNLLTDFHEMDTKSTYFFQPGVPSRQNPLTPARNLELTRAIAEYHARALEEIGSLYYTEERFDDFYFGKGSTYPDIQGSVGILFEQASSRGHLQETPFGPMGFPFTIRNQVRTSLSTLEAARALRPELLEYQADFIDQALEDAANDDIGGWVVDDDGDPYRIHHFLEILARHSIDVRRLARDVEAGGQTFRAGEAWVVPSRQPQYRLVRSLFETRVDFQDSTFYDVSTWTLPLAFDLPFEALARKQLSTELLGEAFDLRTPPTGSVTSASAGEELPYAYFMPWDSYYAPKALFRLQQAGVRALATTRPMQVRGAEGVEELDRGTILIPTGVQDLEAAELQQLLTTSAAEDGVRIGSTRHGLTPSGPDLGSPSLKPLRKPRVALFVGRPADTYEAGEVWHLLDHRYSIPLTLLRLDLMEELRLGRYTHLILVDGDYEKLPVLDREKIKAWVEAGGVLITTRRATQWAREQILAPTPPEPDAEGRHNGESRASASERRPYAEHENDRSKKLISGAIFEVEIDRTHPLAFGLPREKLPVFRNHRLFLRAEPNRYNTFGVYSQSPLLSGYISSENHHELMGSPALLADRLGRGAVVRLLDPPNFRSYWYGTNRLLLNALFFGRILDNTSRQ